MSMRVFAVVGAGPSGLFTAAALAQRFPGAQVDVIDRQLTPFGLVRYGVAPDHPRIKSVAATFDRILKTEGIRFIGGVELCRDVDCTQLSHCYDAVVHATGAPLDRKLGIPGEATPGVIGATNFVRWYNGHPDAPQIDIAASERVVVLGAGNVALDVGRFLVRDVTELGQTDVPDHVLEALANRRVEEVNVVGRRGPSFSKFSNKELRELAKLTYINLTADQPVDMYDVTRPVARETQSNLDLFRSWAEREFTTVGPHLRLRFSLRPVEILGTERVVGVRFARTETTDDGTVVDLGERVDLPADTVISCVGSAGLPVPGLPFDFERSVVPNHKGRVVTEDGTAVEGHYVSGWIKRGATGVIGTNKPDAAETVDSIAEDLGDAGLPADRIRLESLLAAAGRPWYGYKHWCRIDRAEQERGQVQGRDRSKIATWNQLVEVAGDPYAR